jgi:chromosome segregation ATPase
MSTTTANQVRAAALKVARAKDSELKRRRALAALEALEASGASITFTAVAKAAGVSTWLVYAEGIREHIDAARHRQAHHGAAPAPSPSAKRTTTSDSLRTDLAIAQEQIKTLRAERDKLQQRLRLQLGAELEAPDRAHLTARVADLETINRQLFAERDARATEADTANSRVTELEDELSAARESLRRVIKAQNRGP